MGSETEPKLVEATPFVPPTLDEIRANSARARKAEHAQINALPGQVIGLPDGLWPYPILNDVSDSERIYLRTMLTGKGYTKYSDGMAVHGSAGLAEVWVKTRDDFQAAQAAWAERQRSKMRSREATS